MYLATGSEQFILRYYQMCDTNISHLVVHFELLTMRWDIVCITDLAIFTLIRVIGVNKIQLDEVKGSPGTLIR